MKKYVFTSLNIRYRYLCVLGNLACVLIFTLTYHDTRIIKPKMTKSAVLNQISIPSIFS
jgi:hypothetical protein